MSNKMKKILIALCLTPSVSIAGDAFEIGECIIKNGSNTESDILKIVSVQKEEYVTFSYFLSNGKLIQGQDYGKKNKANINNGYSKVKCPKQDDTFSPEKHLDKKS